MIAVDTTFLIKVELIEVELIEMPNHGRAFGWFQKTIVDGG